MSTQVARRLVELALRPARRAHGLVRDDRATCCERFFPGDYQVIRPGADLPPRPAAVDGDGARIAFSIEEERPALRLFLRGAAAGSPRTLRLVGHRLGARPGAAPPASTLPRRCATACASRARSAAPRPSTSCRADDRGGRVVGRVALAAARAAGARRRRRARGARGCRTTRSCSSEGELGLLFEPARRRDARRRSSTRLVSDPALLRASASADRRRLRRGSTWAARGGRVRGAYARWPPAATPRTATRRCASAWPSGDLSTSTCTCTPTTRPTAPPRSSSCSTRRRQPGSARSR